VPLHDDPDMDAQLARTLIGAYVGMADLGEALATAGRVPAGDYDAWHDQWAETAGAAEAAGQRAAEAGLTRQAAHGFLRAAEYRRQSWFFLRHDLADHRVLDAYRAHHEVFGRALPFLDAAVEPFVVPFDPVPLTGYLLRPDAGDDRPRPTVVLPCGFDSTAEEMVKYGAAAMVGQGWNAVTFDGPGQGGVLLEHGVAMRPDFEAVLTPVIDEVLRRPFVDPERLAVVGRSLGGYLAPRGAAHEPRVLALVVDPGQYDFTSRFVSMFSPEDWARVEAADPAMDAQLEGFVDGARNAEFYGARMAAMGAPSFGAWLRLLGDYTLEGHAPLITCPTLVTEGEGDVASQSQVLFDALGGPKSFHRFSAAEGAGGHCEGTGQLLWQDVVLGWLAERFA
jgi:pimeloyl-ACP methyl ester carboxylesterase